MKKILFLLLVLSSLCAMGAPPPIQRNEFTTNLNAAARRVVSNIVTTVLSNSPSMVSPTSYGTMTIGTGGQFAFPDRPNIIPAFNGTGLITEVTIGPGLNYDTGTATLTALGTGSTPETVLAGTNNAAVTNLILSVTNLSLTTIDLTNNATSTNFLGPTSGRFYNAVFIYRPQLVNRTNCYPIGTQYGQTWKTNVNAPLFTTLTQGVHYVLSLTTIDTTVYASMSAWQP